VVGWPVAMATITWADTFPFMSAPELTPPWLGTALVSALVSAGYLAFTWSAYAITSQLPHHRAVRFFARNTVIVFIAHMPLYYGLEYLLRQTGPGQIYAVRIAIEFFAGYVALAFLSEWLRCLVDLAPARERIVALAAAMHRRLLGRDGHHRPLWPRS
jgi:hypothetical protein